MKFTIITILLLLTCVVNCAKILGVFPVAAPSHFILGSALMKGLAEKGHDVTIISPFPEKKLPKNGTYREILLTGLGERMEEQMKRRDMFNTEGSISFLNEIFLVKMMVTLSEECLQHPNFQKFLKSESKFDVVIVTQFLNDAHKAIARHFGAPTILFSTVGANFWVNSLVGNPAPYSYVPDLIIGKSSKMNFYQRFHNTMHSIYKNLVYHFYAYPQQNELIKKYFPNPLDLNDILYNNSIVLMNSHLSFNQPVPYVPNMIDIGGFHINPSKKLPQELQTFLDESKEGVVYFSMGSNLKSAMLPIEKREAILKSFSKLKLKVLWKWEDDVLPGKPPNVKLSKWLPQQDILAHPNIKLFITHGGLLSTTEAVYHGVPILAIPIFGDQKYNAKTAEDNGFGLLLLFGELTEETFSEKIKELLTNPRYANEAKRRSYIFHDRLTSPMDTANYWVEYVIRHKGAPHLRVAALDLPWYKYLLLDVLLVVVLFFLFLYKIVRKICKKLCPKVGKKIKSN